MIRSYKLILMGVFCLSILSCGASREVRYVYVDPPRQQPSQSSQRHNNVEQEVPQRVNTRHYIEPQATSKDCMTLAAEHIEGVYRGFGHGRSSSLTAARNMAMQRAKAEILKKATGVIDALSDDDIESNNAVASERFKESSKQRVRGVLKNTKILCSDIQEGGVHEVRFCLEVSARDIATLLEPIIAELEADSQAKVKAKLNQGQGQ